MYTVSTLDADQETLENLCKELNKSNAKGNLSATGFSAETAQAIVENILKEGVKRTWVLKCNAVLYVGDMVSNMTDGWALNMSPNSKTETYVMFFPKNAEDALHKKMFELFKRIFSGKEDAYPISKQY